MSTPDRSTMFQFLAAGTNPWNVWVASLKVTEIDFSGVDFATIKAPDHFVQFNFPFPVKFDGAHFPADFRFNSAHFHCPTTFVRATFDNGATFVDTRFLGSVVLDHAHFLGQATFRGTKFQDFSAKESFFDGQTTFDATFARHSTFNQARFLEAAWFNSKFERGALFEDTRFRKDVDFGGSSFDAKTVLRATFDGRADFIKTNFNRDVAFDRSDFNGVVSFKDTKFEGNASFVRVTFARDVDFSATSTILDFRELWFNRAVFQAHSYFLKRRFTRNTNFEHATFAYPPQVYDSTLHHDTSFEGTEFGQASDASDERAFRALKQQMSDHQNHVQEMVFFAKEMESRHAALKKARPTLKSRWQRCESRWTGALISIYKRLSNYGQSVGRPAGALLGMLVVCFVLYAQSAVGWRALGDCAQQWQTCGVRMDRSMVSEVLRFTLSQSVPFGSLFKEAHGLFIDKPPIPVQFIAVVQALLTILFAFLIGLGLRNLFRLR